jgi:hypothetical protein
VNVEQGKHNYILIEAIIERINAKTQKLSIRKLEKICNNKKTKFPSMFKMSESKSDLVDCNMFLEDYDEYSAAKTLI